MKKLSTFISAVVTCGAAFAQPATAPLTGPAVPPSSVPAVAPDASPPVVPAVILPLVNPAYELKGVALVEALRKGGYVFYMRHALQIPPTDEKCDGPSLMPAGIEQARTVAAALRTLQIPVGRVRTSEPCRNRETARLLGFATPEITIDINPLGTREGFDFAAARQRQLAETPPAGTNTILVSHVHGSPRKEEWIHLELAEIIVYRPDGKGGTTPVARVRVGAWAELIKLMGL